MALINFFYIMELVFYINSLGIADVEKAKTPKTQKDDHFHILLKPVTYRV